jgi:hypothetical protein
VATGFNRNNGLLMGLGMTILRPVSRSPEKGAETLVADREKVRIITAVTEIDGSGRRVFNLSKDLDVLEGLIAGIGDVGLVIIDPVDAYLGAGIGGIDSHKNAAVRACSNLSLSLWIGCAPPSWP